MALAATACTKTLHRRQIMVATSSVGPGATNMVTAAGAARSNRTLLLVIAVDTYASRLLDPVLQRFELRVGRRPQSPPHSVRSAGTGIASSSPTRESVTGGLATYELQVDVDRIWVRSVTNQASGSTPV